MRKIPKELLLSKFKGSMIGTAIGDALGSPFEGRRNITEAQVLATAEEQKTLKYTDDTHMTIGVAESLIETEGFDAKHMAYRFTENFFDDPFRGYGAGPPKIFWMIRAGEPFENAAEKFYPGGSFGNGAAMRVAPIGLFYHRNPEQLREVAYGSGQITHAHILGKEGAALQAYAVAIAAEIKPKAKFDPYDFVRKLIEFIHHELYKMKLKRVEILIGEEDKEKVASAIGNGIEAFNSVPAAIWSFLSSPDSFEETVIRAISLGGDTDTIGAMAGAISGAYLGYEAIPKNWGSKLESSIYIEGLADKLWRIYSNQI